MRVIDILRKHYPGTWTYRGFGQWDGPNFDVYYDAAGPAPGEDEPSKLAVGVYRRADTQEPVPELNRWTS